MVGLAATTANFIIVGKPLPRVEDTLRIGELMRMAVMSRAKHICGEDSIPSIFSGHGMPHGNRHGHAFYLPWDSHHDGRIDRVMVHVPDGMQAQAQRVVESVNRLWRRDGGEWQLVLESIGGPHSNNALTQPGRVWASVTPYLHPWHCKKGFSVEDQIRRECIERGLPQPIKLARRETIKVGRNRSLRPIHFKRFRTRRGVQQPDRIGSFWQLEFSKDVAGPLALGFACHYGLGMFRPVGTNESQC
ncbi:MAG: type I-U CRISPR-associated protein Cas5/Cas6 [Gammaproteobacteria bacterium]|nr:type I-U CRISPR-associated protein Cas5/Cas6 [Gammaproteobacteria bacterium]